MNIFTLVLTQPLFNALMFLRQYLPGQDLGVAIIALTLLIKLLLYAPSLSAIRSQRSLQAMQPKIDALRKQYAKNKEELSRQLMAAYREHRINPLSSCLPVLIQLPVLIALYQVFMAGLQTDPATHRLTQHGLDLLYPQLRAVYEGQPVSGFFLGFVDLTKTGNYILAVLAGGLQFLQSRMLQSKNPPKGTPGAQDEGMASSMNRQMMYFFPIITVIFSIQFPAGLALYWVVSTIFTVVQQYFFFRSHSIKNVETKTV